MKIRAALATMVVLAGCQTATVHNSNRFSTDVQAYEFNSVASQFMARPTFAYLSQDKQTLILEIDIYGRRVTEYGSFETSAISFQREGVPEYLAAIDKFQEWEAVAAADGDMFTKEIAKVKGVQSSLKFAFHSGNERNHYLMLSTCAVGICIDEWAVYLPASEVADLKMLLKDFAAGNIGPDQTIDQKYN
ncbi:MAG: hypothetical protein GYB49_09380 [Alphaproteobacteria bacterium]|nr:hypothetical protein [Hyphomonas sp.]MBR9807420.1 hypothetical protein [Alphaproteobacteria bacterium]